MNHLEVELAKAIATAEAAYEKVWSKREPTGRWAVDEATARIVARLPMGLRDQASLPERIEPRLLAWTTRYKPIGSVVLSGATGVGKSSAAALVVHKLLSGTWPGKHRIGWLRASEADSSSQDDRLQWKSVALLIIDDIGHEDWRSTNVIWDVLDCRYQCGRISITTTNLPAAGLSKLYSDRKIQYAEALVRRLTEGHKKGEWVQL